MSKVLKKYINYLIKANKVNSVSLNIYDILITFITITSIVAVILLMLKVFIPIYVLLLSIAILISILGIFRVKIVSAIPQFNLIVFAILILALFFRVQPYLYVIGGEDVGVYVNMSRWMEENGTLFVKDNIRENLSEPSKKLYDEYNKLNTGNVKGLTEAVYLPGVYFHNPAESTNVFQFYPLHPAWMSLFGHIFGSDNRVYSLVFFSLISMYSLYLIAYELSGKRMAGYIIALFLALNPLHAFFTKYPVSEIVSLALASSGFYYLIKYYGNCQKGKIVPFYLILSAGLFSSLFFNHISGFLYLPFFILLLLVSLIFIENKTLKITLVTYGIVIFTAFLTSALYGYKYSYPYFHDLYFSTFGSYLGPSWKIKLLISAIVILIIFIVSFYKNKLLKNKFSSLLPYIKTFPIIVYLFIIIGFIKTYQLSFTNTPVLSSSILVLIMYVSAFGFFIFLLSIYHYSTKKNNLIMLGLFFFITCTLLMRVLLGPSLEYQFLYARYLLSDLVPYILLVTALYLAHWLETSSIKKATALVFIIIISLNFGYFTIYQLQGKEAERAFWAMKRLSGGLDKNDLLIADAPIPPVKTSLMYYFNTNVVTVKNIESAKNKDFVEELNRNFNSVYIITNLPRYKSENLEKVASYQLDEFERSANSIPKKFIVANDKNSKYYLYKVNSNDFHDVSPLWGQLVNFQEDNMWTNGDGFIKNLQYSLKSDDKYLVLVTGGYNPFKNDEKKLNLKMSINGDELKYAGKKDDSYYFEIDPLEKEINDIEILSSTFTPKELGMSADNRKLGIDVILLKTVNNK